MLKYKIPQIVTLTHKVKSKCCGIKGDNINGKIQQLET